jgi:hypothetical protein
LVVMIRKQMAVLPFNMFCSYYFPVFFTFASVFSLICGLCPEFLMCALHVLSL